MRSLELSTVGLREQTAAHLAAVAPRYSKSSLAIFRAGLGRFEAFCLEHDLVTVAEIDERALEAFDAWLLGFELSETTVHMAVRATKYFLQWSYKAGLTLWDGATYELTNPRSRIPKPPTVAVMERLLQLPHTRTAEGMRDLFALELLYVLALRRGECCALRTNSIDLNAETVSVVGKGGDERLLPVSPRLGQTARRYLRRARSALLPKASETALLLNNDGRALDNAALSYIVKKYGARLGLVLSPHKLRHACATHLVEAGMGLEKIQALLGHRRIDSTGRYAQILGREVRREFARSHPRARGGAL